MTFDQLLHNQEEVILPLKLFPPESRDPKEQTQQRPLKPKIHSAHTLLPGPPPCKAEARSSLLSPTDQLLLALTSLPKGDTERVFVFLSPSLPFPLQVHLEFLIQPCRSPASRDTTHSDVTHIYLPLEPHASAPLVLHSPLGRARYISILSLEERLHHLAGLSFLKGTKPSTTAFRSCKLPHQVSTVGTKPCS